MPTVFAYRERGEGDVGTAPGAATQVKDIRLLLPSDIVEVEGVSVSLKLARYEFRFRLAQAHTAIRELRGLLLWRSQRIISKKKYSSGTAMMTRSNALIADISQRIRDMATKYRRVRDRLVKLGEVLREKKWGEVLKVLKDKHLRSLTTFDVGYGDGKRKLAWIWNIHSSGEKASVAVRNGSLLFLPFLSSVLTHQLLALKIEFCRARARAHRWQEECILLREEMRRVEQFWSHGVRTWQQRAELYEKLQHERLPPSPDIASFPRLVEDEHEQRVGSFQGKIAYARRQATLREDLRQRSALAHAHLIEPLLQMDKGNGVVVDGSVMVEGKGYIPKKKGGKGKPR